MNARLSGVIGSIALHLLMAGVLIYLMRATQAPLVQEDTVELQLAVFDNISAEVSNAIAPAPIPKSQTPPKVTANIDHSLSVVDVQTPVTPKPEPEPEPEPRQLPKPKPAPLHRDKHAAEVVFIEEIVSEAQAQPLPSISSNQNDQSAPIVTSTNELDLTAPVPAIEPLSPANPTTAEQHYTQQVRSAVAAQRNYPRQARRRGIKGTVLLGFRLSADGTMSRSRVLRSSGSDLLDSSALSSLLKVGRFTPFPVDIAKPTWDFEVAMTFN